MDIQIVVLSVTSENVGDQQCCYGGTGELLSYAEGGGSISRFSPSRQPLHYMLQDYWPKIVCDKLANNTSVYRQLRPTDDCSGYVPPKQGARVSLTLYCVDNLIVLQFTDGSQTVLILCIAQIKITTFRQHMHGFT